MLFVYFFAALSILCFYGLMWENRQRWGNPFLMAVYMLCGCWLSLAALYRYFELNDIGLTDIILAVNVLL